MSVIPESDLRLSEVFAAHLGLIEFEDVGKFDRCYCPHAGPCCHSDHGCCGSCKAAEEPPE